MTSVEYMRQLTPLQNETKSATQTGTEMAFRSAFFFLPLSKPLMFVSLAAAFAFFIVGGGLGQARRQWRMQAWMAPALLLAFMPLLSLLVHDDLQQGVANLDLAYYWLAAFMVCAAASCMQVRAWLTAFVCGLLVAFCYTQASTAGWIATSLIPSSFGNYILYSQLLAMAIVLLSVLYRHAAGQRMKRLYLAAMALFFVGLVSGDGRSGMLAVAVLLPFVFGNIFQRADRVKIVLACAIALLVVLMSPKVQTRIDAAVSDLQLLSKEVKATSLGYRVDMWDTAWEVVRAHPLVGAGPTGFRDAWHKTPRSGQGVEFVEPHNAFLFYASSYGLIGLGALLWLYAAMFWIGWRHRQSLAGGIVFAFTVVVVVGSFTNTMFMGAVSHAWLMLFIGLQGALMRDDREQAC